jgi:hypothetical protein
MRDRAGALTGYALGEAGEAATAMSCQDNDGSASTAPLAAVIRPPSGWLR